MNWIAFVTHYCVLWRPRSLEAESKSDPSERRKQLHLSSTLNQGAKIGPWPEIALLRKYKRRYSPHLINHQQS